MVEMDIENELREGRLGKKKNPKEILCDMAAIMAKHRLVYP